MATLIENAQTAADIIMNFKNYCTYGQTLIIPEGVETIGMNVFHKDETGGYGDNYLTHLELPSTLKSINFRSFAGNTKLTEVVIPHGCEYIYSQAFMGCVSIQRLYLPNTIKTCFYQAFLPNSNMTVFEVEKGFSGALGNNVSFTNANLSAEVMVDVFNNLADLTGQSANTLVFGSTNLNKLTLEQIAIATNKNWNLS
jgi:hypothetical protein